jgi:hypothetical protein
VEDDLWLALQQQVDEDGISLPTTVKDIMETWTLQMGFPLITVTRDYTTGGASVSQVKIWIENLVPSVPLLTPFLICHSGSIFDPQKSQLDRYPRLPLVGTVDSHQRRRFAGAQNRMDFQRPTIHNDWQSRS